MAIRFHLHALERMQERGATKQEVEVAIDEGEQIEANTEGRDFGEISLLRRYGEAGHIMLSR